MTWNRQHWKACLDTDTWSPNFSWFVMYLYLLLKETSRRLVKPKNKQNKKHTNKKTKKQTDKHSDKSEKYARKWVVRPTSRHKTQKTVKVKSKSKKWKYAWKRCALRLAQIQHRLSDRGDKTRGRRFLCTLSGFYPGGGGRWKGEMTCFVSQRNVSTEALMELSCCSASWLEGRKHCNILWGGISQDQVLAIKN